MYKISFQIFQKEIQELEGVIENKSENVLEIPFCSQEYKLEKMVDIKHSFFKNPTFNSFQMGYRYKSTDVNLKSFLEFQQQYVEIQQTLDFFEIIIDRNIPTILYRKLCYFISLTEAIIIGPQTTCEGYFEIPMGNLLELYSQNRIESSNLINHQNEFYRTVGIEATPLFFKIPCIHFRINTLQDIQGLFHRYLNRRITWDNSLKETLYLINPVQKDFLYFLNRYSGESLFLSLINIKNSEVIYVDTRKALLEKVVRLSQNEKISNRLFYSLTENLLTGALEYTLICQNKNFETIFYRLLNDFLYENQRQVTFMDAPYYEDDFFALLQYPVYFYSSHFQGHYGVLVDLDKPYGVMKVIINN